jgi:hypothetical protein
MVGNPYLTGLWKVCPSLGRNPKRRVDVSTSFVMQGRPGAPAAETADLSGWDPAFDQSIVFTAEIRSFAGAVETADWSAAVQTRDLL